MLLSTFFLMDLILLHGFNYHPSETMSKHYSRLKFTFPICWQNKYCIILITWISIWSAWTLFWNSMGNFFLENVTKSISINTDLSQGKGEWIAFREAWIGCSQQGLPSQQWKQLTDNLPLWSLPIYKTHALSLLRFLLIFLRDPDSGLQPPSAYVHVGIEHHPSWDGVGGTQWINAFEGHCGKVYMSTENKS